MYIRIINKERGHEFTREQLFHSTLQPIPCNTPYSRPHSQIHGPLFCCSKYSLIVLTEIVHPQSYYYLEIREKIPEN